jgi:hypothetical protein
MMRRIAGAVGAAGAAGAVLAASLAGTAAIPAAAQAATPAGITETVIQTGLNAPRHLVLTRAGLVVTEAGTGGPVGTSNCATGPSTEGAGTTPYCTGQTGAIFTIPANGRSFPVLTKLPSVIEENIQEVTGVSGTSYAHGQQAVTIDDFLVTADGGNSLLPKPFASLFGTLWLRSGGKTRVVNLAAFAAAHPQSASSLGDIPGEAPYDSDPYDVVAYRGGWAVADAGANDVLYVSATGQVSMLARFPAVAEQLPASWGTRLPSPSRRRPYPPRWRSGRTGPCTSGCCAVCRPIRGLPTSTGSFRGTTR